MRIGVNIASHGLNMGGGWKASWWHILALKQLGHDISIFTTSGIHPRIRPLLHGIPIRTYRAGVEAEFDGFITLNHFGYAQPLAKQFNIQHMFFPNSPVPPPEGLTLTANSRYTASHIEYKWSRKAEVLYIPIEGDYYVGSKENLIIHISRFAEPNEWADKGHRQMIQCMRLLQHELPGWRLLLAGTVEYGQDSYVDSLMEFARGLPVEFMFEPTDEELRGLYSKAAILWHCTGISLPMIPSAQEHMGIAPLEAQASGCVPIVYRSGGMPEVVRENQTGLLFDDVRQMGEMTIDLTRQLHTWSAFQQYGLMWAKSWQDWDAFKGRIQEMLDGKSISPLPMHIPDPPYHQEDITCVIPTLDNYDMLMKCLDSLKKTAPRMPILIINNGAENIDVPLDGVSVANFNRNLGFAGAYKWAEDIVKTPLVLWMNDDVEAFNLNWLLMMVVPFADPSVGIVGAKLLFPDGRLQHAGGAIDWGRPDVGYHLMYGYPDNFDASITKEVPFVTAACMLMRRELFKVPEELVGGLCYEEAWISSLAREQGYKTIYQPASALIHAEGVTRKRTPEDEEKVEHNKALFKERWMK